MDDNPDDGLMSLGDYVVARLTKAVERLEQAHDEEATDAAADHLETTLEELTALLGEGEKH